MTTRRFVGKGEKLTVLFEGKTISIGWSSFQFDETRFLFRLYCHDENPQPPLKKGDKGEITVHTPNCYHVMDIKVTREGKPYTFDDAVVYEFTGKVL